MENIDEVNGVDWYVLYRSSFDNSFLRYFCNVIFVEELCNFMIDEFLVGRCIEN